MKALPLAFRMAWAARLREAMERRNYKAEELAEKIHRSSSIIYRWLAGQIPELPDVLNVAEMLDVDPAWLIWGVDRKKALPGRARRSIKNLVLAFTAAAAAMLAPWPSGSVSAQARALYVPEKIYVLPLIGSKGRRLQRGMAHA